MNKKLYKNLNITKDIGVNGIGDNLATTYYDKIKKLRPYNNAGDMEQWQKVIDLSSHALSETKDVNIVIWLIEASVYKEKLKGLFSIKILYDLLSKYPNCYPLEENKKQNSLNYLKDNILSWLINEEIIQGVYYKEVFNMINTGVIEENLADVIDQKDKTSVKKYINSQLVLIEDLKSLFSTFHVNNHQMLYGIVSILNEFLKKLEYFYKLLIDQLSIKKEEIKKEPVLLNIDDIYREIGKFVEQGMHIDTQDILLHLINRIIRLHNKGCLEIYKVLKEDSIEKIFHIT